jgi:hypothetical protein
MLSILRKARLKDKEMRVLMLYDESDAWSGLYKNTVNGISRGLDNAGKTTIVKQIMNEDVNTVSPTLGFIIKTIDYQGYVFQHMSVLDLAKTDAMRLSSYKLNICTLSQGSARRGTY